MIVVQLLNNDYPAMVLEARTPRALAGIFATARAGGYTVNVVQGQEFAWVQTALQQHLVEVRGEQLFQELFGELEAA